MGVIATEIKIGSWRGRFGEDSRVSYTLRVETDDVADGPFVIAASPMVPRRGSVYQIGNETATAYLCKTFSPKVDENDKMIWEIEIEYEQIEIDENAQGGGEGADKVLASRFFQFDMSFRYETIPMLKDLDEKTVQNTAGELYSKPLERNVKIIVFNVRRKEFTNPLNRQVLYNDSVNDGTFWGQDAGQVLIESYLSDGQGMDDKATGWNARYSIAVRPKSAGRWDEVEIPSMGFGEKIADTGPAGEYQLREIINKATGKPFSVEQYLDAQGRWLDRLASNFTPHMDKYRRREKRDFSKLYLPDLSTLTYSVWLEQEEQGSGG